MDFLQKFFLSLKISAFIAAVVFAFWELVRMGHGEVPMMDRIVITDFFVIALPFAISRLWDMLIGLFFVTPLIFILMNEKTKNDRILTSIVSLMFLLGLVIGSIYGIFFLIEFGVITAMVALVLFNLIAGGIFGLKSGLSAFLGSGMGIGLTVGLATGLFFVLIMVIASLCGSGIFAIIQVIRRKRWAR